MIKVIINDEGYIFKYDMISYDDIVRFALGDTDESVMYNISYTKGLLNSKGTIKQGDVIRIVPEMIFNAVKTGNV